MSESTLFEYEGERTAAETAVLLRELADGLDGGGTLAFGGGDRAATVAAPAELTLELELEREPGDDGPDGFELEIELEWTADGEGASGGSSSESEGAPGADAGSEPASGAESAGTAGTGADTPDEGAGDGSGEGSTDRPAEPDVVTAQGAGGSRARFQVYRDRAGEWRWRLRHRNGNIIATSGEGYTSRRNVEKGLRSVVANAPGADVEFEGE